MFIRLETLKIRIRSWRERSRAWAVPWGAVLGVRLPRGGAVTSGPALSSPAALAALGLCSSCRCRWMDVTVQTVKCCGRCCRGLDGLIGWVHWLAWDGRRFLHSEPEAGSRPPGAVAPRHMKPCPWSMGTVMGTVLKEHL